MKTSVIRYRVADFLKQHPPFNEMSDDDRMKLAASGRVIFHESDEYIFRKNQPKAPTIWVVQQGSVEVLDETPHGEQLRDLLGEGDLLGSEPSGDPLYRYSAKTTSDVILYTINAGEFAQVAARNPAVACYLAAQVSITEEHPDDVRADGHQTPLAKTAGKTTWLDAPGPPIDFLRRRLLALRPGTTCRQAATKMAQAHSDWVAVADANRRPVGLVTGRELRDHVADGSPAGTLIEAVMNSHLAIAPPGLTAGAYFLLMMQRRCRELTITADGTAASPLEGVIADSDLSLVTGRNPALLLARTLEATTIADWSRLLQQQKALLASALAGPSNIDLCDHMASEFLRALLQAVIRQSHT